MSIVCVLTLSLRFNRVICAGLTPYFLISEYWDTPFSFIIFHRLSYTIITFKLTFYLNVTRKWCIVLLTNIGYAFKMEEFKMKKRVLVNNILAIVTSVMLLSVLCSCGETYVSGDNKCDICGKKATHTIGSEEYCNKHYKDARDWYIKKALDE